MKLPKITVLLSFVGVFGTLASFAQKPCVPQKHAKFPAIVSMTYHKARPKLLAAGWQPLATIHHNKTKEHSDISYGNGAIFWKRGYLEIEACSGTGLAPCSFLFSDAYGNKLRVVTLGEEYPKQKAFARVDNYKFVCDPE